jgi:ADP-ribosylglycohydrolase
MTVQQFLDVLFFRQPELAGCILAAADPRWARLQPPVHTSVVLRDRFRGALVGGAIGDAMGRPNEGRPTEVARERKVRAFQPWHGWNRGPKGTITDDTQMTMWVAEAILEAAEEQRRGGAEAQARKDAGVQGSIGETGNPGRGDEGAVGLRDQLVDPDDLAQRFTRERIRGIGRATREFVRNYKDLGKPWHEAGVPSAGNGTAMRAAPVGLVHLGDPYRIYRDSLLQSVVSHRDSMAIAAASCQAYAVARAAAAPPGSLAPLANRLDLCADLALLLDGLETPGYPLNGSTGAPSLHGRIGVELPQFLTTRETPFATWHNGAYVLGSFPCALWCFLASPEDFEQTLFTAVDAGHDADTVAAMACTLSGAYHGYARLPQRLLSDLEYHDRLLELADGLHELHRRLYGTS